MLQQLLSSPIKALTLYSDVELTEDEIAEALIDAKSRKSKLTELEKRKEESRERSKILTEAFTMEGLLKFCAGYYRQRFAKEYIIDKGICEILAMYFTDDARFEAAGYSLDKGVLLMGNVGVGKTELMKFFQKNKKQCFKVVPCNEVADDYSTYKNDIAEVYSTPISKAMNDADVFFQRQIGFCFDDLGTEEIKNDFGNKKNVMADILMSVYNKKDFTKFFITTNLSSEEIEAKYGTRIKSRLREMFNVFKIDGEDKRK